MNLSIVLVLVLNFLGTHSHSHCQSSTKWWCQVWIQVFGDSDDTSMEDVQLDVIPNGSCLCVPANKCNQIDINTQDLCYNGLDPNLVCCRKPVRSTTLRPHHRRSTMFTTPQPNPWSPTERPPQKPEAASRDPPKITTRIPARIPPSQPTTQVPPLITTQISQVTNTGCICMPLTECHDDEFESNSKLKQGSCPAPDDVCCLGLVQNVTTTQSQRPRPSQIPIQSQPVDSTPRPQLPSPTQASPPADKECICTPFFKCYDEETSSNLTNIVNDRASCGNPNDVCCYNLVKNTTKPTIVNLVKSSSGDCAGSCIAIQECPYLLNKLKDAQGRNSDAVKELRRSVCSNTNGNIRVCCPASGSPPCQFPFIYEGVTYSECTAKDDPDGKLWCSTQTDDQNNHIKDKYRLCTSDDTPGAAGN